jgi:hypothetical protein
MDLDAWRKEAGEGMRRPSHKIADFTCPVYDTGATTDTGAITVRSLRSAE